MTSGTMTEFGRIGFGAPRPTKPVVRALAGKAARSAALAMAALVGLSAVVMLRLAMYAGSHAGLPAVSELLRIFR